MKRLLLAGVALVAVAAGAVWIATDGRTGERQVQLSGGIDRPTSPGGPLYERLVLRDAPGGVALRLYGDGWSNPPAAGDPTYAMCDDTRYLVVEVSNRAAALQHHAQSFTPAVPLSLVSAEAFGGYEGELAWYAILRTTPDVTLVRGAGDEAEPSDGFAMLGGTGALPHGTTVEAIADGQVVGEVSLGEPPTRCYTPGSQPTLPDPGEQPDDPAAAEAGVRDAYIGAFDHSASAEDKQAAVAHLEDLASLMDQAAQSFPDAVATITVEVREVVFTAPDAASVRFELFYEGGAQFGEQIGKAVLIDGTWRVARETMCTVLGWAGVQCPTER